MKKKIDLFEIINDFILCIIGFICIYPFLYEIFVAVSDFSAERVKLRGF